jgi:serine/threonine protein phosphatase PrpC
MFAVFDGHGGPEVSHFCQKVFSAALLRSSHFQDGRYREALEETFLMMDRLLANDPQTKLPGIRARRNHPSNVGSTAVVVLVTETDLFIANAGDSRAILSQKDRSIHHLSRDHKPELEEEGDRIRRAGGFVMEGRVNSVLNLTRAIGDLEFKRNSNLSPEDQIITSFPEVSTFPLSEAVDFLIIGCDGIWESLPPQDMCHLVIKRIRGNRSVRLSTICEELLDTLVARDVREGIGCDNMTCILVKFK